MNEKEIGRYLEPFPKKWLYAFIARIAAQSLPGLIEKNNQEEQYFDYWSDDKRYRYLFILLQTVAVTSTGYHNNINKHVKSNKIRTGNSITIFVNQQAYEAGKNISKERVIAKNTSIIICESYIAAANLYNASYIEGIFLCAQGIGLNIDYELISLKDNYLANHKNTEYLYHHLYISQTQEWLQLGKKFVQVLREIGYGFDIWADWFQGRIDGVPTNKEFLEAVAFLPKEILAQEPAHINAYLKSLGNTAGALNRVRVIFLGYGEAGKTSLIRALNGLDVVAGKEQMTPGIDISTWQVPGTEIIAHFWDFGGQVVAHATHQFFLRSRCLYVLLLDGRTEINANEQAEYWLEHVRAFGSKAPVMLVGNKADLCAVNLDMARLKEKHENMIGFYPLSCTQYQGEFADKFLCFKNDLIKEAGQLGVHQIRFGKAHLAVLDELTGRAGKEFFLPKAAWLDLCSANMLLRMSG